MCGSMVDISNLWRLRLGEEKKERRTTTTVLRPFVPDYNKFKQITICSLWHHRGRSRVGNWGMHHPQEVRWQFLCMLAKVTATLTHPPSWSSSNLYQLLPSTTIHSILLVQMTCMVIFLHNLSPCPLWSTSWSGALHLTFHTFLHPISVFFSQHMPITSQPVLL